MIPLFPRFKKLDLSDKPEIETVTSQFPPYSDFNFASMWSYDTNNTVEISKLYNNLVIKFQDYVTLEPFFTFIGNSKISDTILTLRNHAKTHHISDTLKLIPEAVIATLPKTHKFKITEDPDNHDYIVSVDDVIEMKGTKYLSKRNHIHAFIRTYGKQMRVSPADPDTIMDIFLKWESSRGRKRGETENEMKAIQKIAPHIDDLTLHAFMVSVGDTPAGFSIHEKTFDAHGMMHYEKADTKYTGIFEFMKLEAAKHLQALGCRYINMEQDLGLPGLRAAKLSYRPHHYLKKFIIEV